MGWLDGFFGTAKGTVADLEHSAAIVRIEQALAGVPAEEARFLACIALLTARVAHLDSEISAGERLRIRDVLQTQLKLPEKEAEAVTGIAIESTLAHAVENHLVLRRANEITTREQKYLLLRALFHVAADADVSEAESTEIGAIAEGLLISRSEFITIRSEFREHLAILKNLPS